MICEVFDNIFDASICMNFLMIIALARTGYSITEKYLTVKFSRMEIQDLTVYLETNFS